MQKGRNTLQLGACSQLQTKHNKMYQKLYEQIDVCLHKGLTSAGAETALGKGLLNSTIIFSSLPGASKQAKKPQNKTSSFCQQQK